MAKITADYMISSGTMVSNPLIETDNQGVILSVVSDVAHAKEQEDVEYYPGLLIPGMVNSHSHLEYSYVKGKIERGGGLPYFISTIISIKINDKTTDQQKAAAALEIDKQMTLEGVVAVADHNNNDYVYDVKRQSQIYYHSLVELYDEDGQSDDETFHAGLSRAAQHSQYGLASTVIPHACYTMSDRLLQLCGGVLTSDQGKQATGVLSVHYKESVAMAGDQESDRIFAALSPQRDSTLLVHSVYASPEDVDRAKELLGDKLTVVVCPLSNYYIENGMADVMMLREKGVRIAIGTDSLSSNDDISMVSEMYKVSECFPEVPLTEVVSWATENGAKALGIDSWAGSITAGKRSGIVHISNIDPQTMRLTALSKGSRVG
ncbi:MAG: amidohydrolase family protein [Rikenellaceae bacterium]